MQWSINSFNIEIKIRIEELIAVSYFKSDMSLDYMFC